MIIICIAIIMIIICIAIFIFSESESKRKRQMWEMEQRAKKQQEDKMLLAINTYLMDVERFEGTASELLEKIPEVDLQPNQLTRQLNIKAGRLYEDYGIKYNNQRCHDGRIIILEYENE